MIRWRQTACLARAVDPSLSSLFATVALVLGVHLHLALEGGGLLGCAQLLGAANDRCAHFGVVVRVQQPLEVVDVELVPAVGERADVIAAR